MSIDHHPHQTHQSGPEDETPLTFDRASSPTLMDRLRTKTARRVMGAAGVIAVGAAGFGISKLTGGGNPETNPQATHSVPIVTPSAELPSPVPTTEAPAPTPTPELITPSNPELITALENMTPQEFEQQPLEARMAWVVSRLQDEAENATTYKAFTYTDPKTQEVKAFTFKDGSEMSRHNPIANLKDPTSGTPLTRFSSPDEVLYYDLTINNLSGAAMKNDIYDQANSRKWIAARAADPDSAYYKDKIDSVEKSSKASVMTDAVLHKYDVDGGTSLYKTTVEGKEYEAMTIAYSYGSGKAKAEYIFVPRAEMGQTEDGKQEGLWLKTKQVLEPVKPIEPVQ